MEAGGGAAEITGYGEMDTTLNVTSKCDEDRLLPPLEVAKLFGVNPRTLRDWAIAGKINARRTLGGHRRYRESEVRALLNEPAEVA